MKALGLVLALALHASPLTHAPVPAVPPRAVVAPPKLTDAQCLANAIHYEAGGEPVEGQRAVYEVIMSRVAATRSNVCAVVTAPKQFSWVGLKPFMPLTKQLHTLVSKVKRHPKVLESRAFRWFYSGDDTPYWAVTMECRVIGGHRFCKEGEKNNNGSNWQVRDQGESPQEVQKLDNGDRVHDLRNRVSPDHSGGIQHAPGTVEEQRI